jgi:hypothetical protein
MTKYQLEIKYAENGAFVLSKCQTCRDDRSHVFVNDTVTLRLMIDTWHKLRMEEHDKKHMVKR